MTSLILWRPRKLASPTSAAEGLPRLPPPPRLIGVRKRAAPCLNARRCPPVSPRALRLTSRSPPTLPCPLTSSPRWRLTPTRPAPPRAAEPRTCQWTRARPAETRHPACSHRAELCKRVTGSPPPFPAQLPPRAHLLVPHSRLPPPSSAALLCPAIRSSKRSPKSTKRRIARRPKGSGWFDAAPVLLTQQSRPERLEPKRGAVLRKRAEPSSTKVPTATEVSFRPDPQTSEASSILSACRTSRRTYVWVNPLQMRRPQIFAVCVAALSHSFLRGWTVVALDPFSVFPLQSLRIRRIQPSPQNSPPIPRRTMWRE